MHLWASTVSVLIWCMEHLLHLSLQHGSRHHERTETTPVDCSLQSGHECTDHRWPSKAFVGSGESAAGTATTVVAVYRTVVFVSDRCDPVVSTEHHCASLLRSRKSCAVGALHCATTRVLTFVFADTEG